MTRSRLLLGAAVLLVGVWWSGVFGSDDSNDPDASADDSSHSGRTGSAAHVRTGGDRSGARAWVAPQRLDGAVTIAGTVIDAQSSGPVGNVEVVFRSALGEETAMASADGKYHIDVPAGVYRAFVRDETVLSVGRIDHVRLPGLPTADTAGVPDEALMPIVVASTDVEGVDLSVMRGGAVTGRVVDRAGHPIKNAVLRAKGPNGVKPTLGTDVAESDETGAYEMRLPAGDYEIEATHPRYAGVVESPVLSITAGDHVTANVTLTAGCVIAGRVVRPGGVTGEGAIEKQWGPSDLEFAPTGKIAEDGTFRWATTEEVDVTLRAWPWKAPPSQTRRFTCRDGARFENVVFDIPDQRPDIEGILVDASGAPVPLAFVDLAPMDPGGISQQERTDAEGKFGVFHMPSGRYRITAHAAGRGIVSTNVTSPQTQVRLVLGGTGRIEGTTTLLVNGSFEMHLVACSDDWNSVAIPEDRRLVTVFAGKFKLDQVPACALQIMSSWHGHPVMSRLTVPANGVARLDLAIGPPHRIKVHGIVRSVNGGPLAGAFVTASYAGDPGADATTTSDATGHFSLETFAGASLTADVNGSMGFGVIDPSSTGSEEVPIFVEDRRDDGAPDIDIPEPEPDDPGVPIEPDLVN